MATTTASESGDAVVSKYSLPPTARDNSNSIMTLESAISAVDPKCHSVLFFQLAEAWETYHVQNKKARRRGSSQTKFLSHVALSMENISAALGDREVDKIVWVESQSQHLFGTFILSSKQRGRESVFELAVTRAEPPNSFDMFSFPFETADGQESQLRFWLRPASSSQSSDASGPALIVDDRLSFWRSPGKDVRLVRAVIRMANAMLKEWPTIGLSHLKFLSCPDLPNKLKGSYFVALLARCFLRGSYFGEIIQGCFANHLKTRVAEAMTTRPSAYLEAVLKIMYHTAAPSTPSSEYGRLGTEAYLHATLVLITSPLLRHVKAKFTLGKLVGVGGQGIVHRLLPARSGSHDAPLVIKAPVSGELRKHHYKVWQTLLGVQPSTRSPDDENAWLFPSQKTKTDEFTIVMTEANGDLRGLIRPSAYLKHIDYGLVRRLIHDVAHQIDVLVSNNLHHYDIKPHNIFIYERGLKPGKTFSPAARFMLGDFDLYKDRIVITPYYCHPLVWLWFHKVISNHLYHQYEPRYLAPEWWSLAMTALEAVWPLKVVTDFQYELLDMYQKWSADIRKRLALPTDMPDAACLLSKYKARVGHQADVEAADVWKFIDAVFSSKECSDHARLLDMVRTWRV